MQGVYLVYFPTFFLKNCPKGIKIINVELNL